MNETPILECYCQSWLFLDQVLNADPGATFLRLASSPTQQVGSRLILRLYDQSNVVDLIGSIDGHDPIRGGVRLRLDPLDARTRRTIRQLIDQDRAAAVMTFSPVHEDPTPIPLSAGSKRGDAPVEGPDSELIFLDGHQSRK